MIIIEPTARANIGAEKLLNKNEIATKNITKRILTVEGTATE